MNFLDGIFAAETNTKLLVAVVATLVGATWAWFLKRRRLRAAIKIEVERTNVQFGKAFDDDILKQLRKLLNDQPDYIVTIFTSDRHVVIGNLTDDVAYIAASTAAKVLEFNSIAELIDDIIHFMRTSEFSSLPIEKKLRILERTVSEQQSLARLVSELLKEL